MMDFAKFRGFFDGRDRDRDVNVGYFYKEFYTIKEYNRILFYTQIEKSN